MKPMTLIEWGFAASFATAAPVWICDDFNVDSLHASQRAASDIIFEESVETQIISPSAVNHALSGYGILKQVLNNYLSLEDGWDQLGSKAPLADEVNLAIKFVDNLPSGIPLPKPMLSSNGEVGLYWDIENIYADVAFEGNLISVFIRNRDIDDHEKLIELSLEDMVTDHLEKLLSPLATA